MPASQLVLPIRLTARGLNCGKRRAAKIRAGRAACRDRVDGAAAAFHGRATCAFSPTMRRAACPEVLAAIAEANRLDTAYDGDAWSRRLNGAFSALFEREVEALWVSTGTAANSLALAALCPPHGRILCHRDAHIQIDECGAPEFYTGGAKLLLGEGEGAKLTPDTVAGAARRRPRRRPPGPAGARSRSPTPPNMAASTRPTRRRRSARSCRARGLGFHVDGARFANAVASLGCAPADLTWRAGVDALSFGFTKNGGLSAECLVFFRSRARRGDPLPAQARRPSPLQGPLSRRADPGDARGRSVAAQRPRRQRGGGAARRGGGRRPAAPSGRGQRDVRPGHARTRRRRCARRASISTTGARARRGW